MKKTPGKSRGLPDIPKGLSSSDLDAPEDARGQVEDGVGDATDDVVEDVSGVENDPIQHVDSFRRELRTNRAACPMAILWQIRIHPASHVSHTTPRKDAPKSRTRSVYAAQAIFPRQEGSAPARINPPHIRVEEPCQSPNTEGGNHAETHPPPISE